MTVLQENLNPNPIPNEKKEKCKRREEWCQWKGMRMGGRRNAIGRDEDVKKEKCERRREE